MPELEPKCCECRWLRYVDISKAYCCGSPDSPCSSNVDAERKADTAPAWCPLRKEKGNEPKCGDEYGSCFERDPWCDPDCSGSNEYQHCPECGRYKTSETEA